MSDSIIPDRPYDYSALPAVRQQSRVSTWWLNALIVTVVLILWAWLTVAILFAVAVINAVDSTGGY